MVLESCSMVAMFWRISIKETTIFLKFGVKICREVLVYSSVLGINVLVVEGLVLFFFWHFLKLECCCCLVSLFFVGFDGVS